jgi:hypothetical protein
MDLADPGNFSKTRSVEDMVEAVQGRCVGDAFMEYGRADNGVCL